MSSFKTLLDEKNDTESMTRMNNQNVLTNNRRRYIIIGAAVSLIGLAGLFIIGLSNSGIQEQNKLDKLEFEFVNEKYEGEANANCDDLPVDIISMARGVDITKLDVFPTTPAELRQSAGFVRQVIKLTCQSGYSKRLGNGLVVKLPDQVKPSAYEIVSEHSSSYSFTRHTEKRSEDLKKQMALDFGILQYIVGMFSASLWYKDMRNSFISTNASLFEAKIAHVVRKADFSASSASGVLTPHDDFSNLLRTLPDNFTENPAGYMNVINQFGTHYFAFAKFGGFIQNSTEFYGNVYDSHNSIENGFSLKADVPINNAGTKLSTGIGTGSSNNEELNRDALSSVTKKVFYGGNISLARAGNIEKWLVTVEESPKLFSGNLIPISSLVEDEAKSRALDAATQVHLGRAYVRDLEEQLQIIRQLRVETNLSEIDYMLVSLQKRNDEAFGDPLKLLKLGEEVTALIYSAPIPLVATQKNMQGYTTITVIKADLPTKWRLQIFPVKREAYVRIRIWKSSRSIEASRTYTTKTVTHINTPYWNEKFEEPMEMDGIIEFCVWDKKGVYDSNSPGKQMTCSDLSIRDIVKKELNDKPMLVGGLSYKGQPVNLSVRITWYQRKVQPQ